MKKIVAAAIGCTFIGLSSAASAAIYDFTAEGDRLERGYTTFQTGVGNPMPLGLSITASSTIDDPLADGSPDLQAHVYLDGATTGPGGLGVCGDLRTNLTCEPNSDDNQVPGETVSILSTVPGNGIIGLTFTGDHQEIVAGTTLHLTVDGSLLAPIDLGALPDVNNLSYLALATAAMSISYEITGDGAQVYLASLTTVPVPAAFWLFGSVLLGFIAFSRRTRI